MTMDRRKFVKNLGGGGETDTSRYGNDGGAGGCVYRCPGSGRDGFRPDAIAGICGALPNHSGVERCGRGNACLGALGVYLINVKVLPVFHINDYPGSPPRTELKDSDCIFPGDGICPFQKVLPLLYDTGFRGLYRSNFSTGAIGKRWM